jgi:ribosomal protein S18 acetylase RimI-like enzyme
MQREVSGQLRPLDLPRDFEGISKLVETAFAEDLQRTGLQFREELKVFRRLVPWALVLGRFNKFFRELLGGYVWEDHGQIVGSVVVQPRGLERRKWNISAVATHPDYRRRGIARCLMEAAIEHIRERGGELTLLAVHSHNTPAYQLYLGLGFAHFDSVTLLRLDGIPNAKFKPIKGYVVRPMSPGEWRTRYELAKEAVPAEVQAFNPLSEREFRVGPWMRLLQTFSHFLERVEVHIWAAEALLTKALGALKNYPDRGVLARVWSSRAALLDLI